MSSIPNRRQFAASLWSRIFGCTGPTFRPVLYRFGQWLVSTNAPVPHSDNIKSADTIKTQSFTLAEPVATAEHKAHELSQTCTTITLPEQFPDRTIETDWAVETYAAAESSTTATEVQFNPESREPENEIAIDTDDRLVTIGAVCNVLEILERQLADVNQDVESSVAGVCKGFQGMAARAQAAVSAASDSVGSGARDGGAKDLISEMQKVLALLIENVRSSSDFTQTVAGKLLNLETRLAAVESTLADVEALANKAKLVALNGQIEAARLGTAGLAFAVVAKETKTLSTHAAETSDSIRSLIGELSKEVKSTSAEIRERTQKDASRFQESESQATVLLHDIDLNQKKMLASLNATSEISGELRRDIASAVMSMQFQDRVSQRIAHVVETLDVLVKRVDPETICFSQAAAKDRSDLWLSEISKSYTMDSERMALGAGEMASAVSNSAVEEFDVELF